MDNNNGNGPRIIKPGTVARGLTGNPHIDRQRLADANRRLAADRDDLARMNKQQAEIIQAMNRVFTKIAEKLGTPVPATSAEGPAALEAMMTRLDELLVDEPPTPAA